MPDRKQTIDTRGSQILEFAVVLPLLVVMVVGIFDFGQAFSMRQKLTHAARDGARLGSSEPTTDLGQPAPVTVSAIRDLVDSDMTAAGLNDCGLGSIQQSATLVWTATGSCATSMTFTLTIDRGYVAPQSSQPGITIPGTSKTLRLISTQVVLSYPYQWHFNKIIQLLVPNATYAAISQIQVDAISPNQD
jgi:Flp pilus assembly protein TadG